MHNPKTPREAVAQTCNQICSRGNEYDTWSCQQIECELHPYRPGGQREKARHWEVMRAITRFCLEDCSGGDPEACTHCLPRTRLGQVYCPLFTRRPFKLPQHEKQQDIVSRCLEDRDRIQNSLALINEARNEYMEGLK